MNSDGTILTRLTNNDQYDSAVCWLKTSINLFPASITPTPAVTCSTTLPSGDSGALISAIQTGNSSSSPTSPYVICLGSGTFTLTAAHNTLDGGNGLPQITGNVMLYGTGAVIERQSTAPAFRLLRVNSGAKLKVEGVTLRGGAAGTSSGGAVRNLGTLELVNAIIENNTAANGAGILNNVNATMTATNSTIRTNTATTNGGGLLSNTGSSTTLTNVTFTGNITSTASGLGGGVFMTGATLSINGGTFSTNQARNGGAVFVNAVGTSASISGTTFTGNTAAVNGGAVYLNANTLSISDSTFTSNTAQANGGAMQTTTGTTLNLTNVNVSNNSAGGIGGGVMSGGMFTITGSVLTGNSAGVRGGAISAANGTGRSVNNTCLSGNNAPSAREVNNDGTGVLNATGSYWGSASGPSVGQVSANVDTSGWLTGCG
jgi:predicted outer membrane repeat protein